MAVLAVQHIRRMRGGAQGQLMLGADGHAYVVKFQNNPQHMRVLANEFLASRLAAAVGLTAPEAELVEVSSWLVENTPELEMDLGRTRVRCQPGLQFGSRFVGGLMPGQVVDYLPEEQLAEVTQPGRVCRHPGPGQVDGKRQWPAGGVCEKAAGAPLSRGFHRLRILFSRRGVAV